RWRIFSEICWIRSEMAQPCSAWPAWSVRRMRRSTVPWRRSSLDGWAIGVDELQQEYSILLSSVNINDSWAVMSDVDRVLLPRETARAVRSDSDDGKRCFRHNPEQNSGMNPKSSVARVKKQEDVEDSQFGGGSSWVTYPRDAADAENWQCEPVSGNHHS